MRLQRKMPAFSPNFLGDKVFFKLKVFPNFRANRPKFRGNCVFCLNDITPGNEVSARERSHGSPLSSQLAQQRCNIVVTTLWHGRKWELCRRRFPTLRQRRSPTLSRRCHNIAATLPQHLALDFLAILLRTILISFPLWKREGVTKVLSGIKHTSSLFKRTLYL